MTASMPTAIPTTANLRGNLVDNLSTFIAAGGLTAPATTITVDDTTGFPSAGLASLRKAGGTGSVELFSYTGKTSTTFTGVTRNFNSRYNAAWAEDDVVELYWVADFHNRHVEETIAIANKLFTQFGSGLTDITMSAGNIGMGVAPTGGTRLRVVGTGTSAFTVSDASNYTIALGYSGTGNEALISTGGSTAKLCLGTNTVGRIFIAGDGKIGINTNNTTANYQLRINATNTLGLSIYSTAAASAAYFYLENDAGNSWTLAHGGTSGSNPNQLMIGYNGTNFIQCNSSGNINFIGGDLTVTRSSTGSIILASNNSSNTSGAHAQVQLVTAGSSAGDPKLVFSVDGLSSIFFSLGVDNDDSDKFKLSYSAALGTNDILAITPSDRNILFSSANMKTTINLQTSLANASVFALTPYVVTGSINTIILMCQSEVKWSGIAICRMGGTPAITKIGGGAQWDVSTSALTGTTGVNGNITLSSQASAVQFENRSGGTAQFYITIISGG